MQTSFTPAQLADPDSRRPRRYARLRSLRFLHRDLPNLSCCWATSSTARAAASISSKRCWSTTARPTRGWSSISIAVFRALLHDDLPVGRSITCISSIRPRAASRRRIERPMVRSAAARLSRERVAAAAPFRLALSAPRWRGRCAALCRRGSRQCSLRAGDAPSPSPVDARRSFPREAEAGIAWRCRGCAQQVLAPEINEATIRLLTRHGCEVVVVEGADAAARSPIIWPRRAAP